MIGLPTPIDLAEPNRVEGTADLNMLSTIRNPCMLGDGIVVTDSASLTIY